MTASTTKQGRRQRRANRRVQQRHIYRQSAALATLSVIPLVISLSGAASAQSVSTTPGLVEKQSINSLTTGLFGLGATQNSNPANAPGLPFAELLRGNGGGLGYVLTHGAVIPDTLSVSVGGNHLKLGQDFYLDADNGSLFFLKPIGRFDAVSVSYRYLDGKDATRQPMSMPGLQFSLNSNTSLGLLYGMTPGNGSGLNTSTYGLAMNSKFGAGGLSTYSGLMYFSSAQASGNTVLPTHLKLGDTKATAAADAKKMQEESGNDHLLVQDLALKSGGLAFRAGFQDVGKKFSGFQAMRLNNAGNKATLDQIGVLEGEKGVKRLGFGLGLALDPKAKTPSGLSLDWSQIQDEKGSISQQSLGFTSSGFHVNYAARDVSDKFAAFKGLREADKAQWEHEKGLKTATLGLGFNFGADKKGVSRGLFDFQQQNFGDKSGSLHRDAFALQAGRFGFALTNRASDHDFKRLNDLSDADKTTLAFDLYQQYDPNAKAAQVTAKDKADLLKEAGLAREGLRANLGLGKSGAVAFTQMRVTDKPAAATQPASNAGPAAAPSLRRDSLALQVNGLDLSLISRRADAKFARIADLADVDKNYLALDIRRQFDPDAKLEQVTQKDRDQAVKEIGLSRDALRGKILLGKNGKNGLFTLNQFRLADETPAADPNATPADANRAITRQSLAYTGKALQFAFVTQSIGEKFGRLADLSDVERAQFGQEHGLQRQQASLSWQMLKGVKFGFTQMRIGGTDDAIRAAAQAALAANADTKAATKLAASGLQRQSLTLESKGLTFATNASQVDKGFTRAADLALPDADKHLIDTERGFQKRDLTLHYDRLKWLKLDLYDYRADNALDQLNHATHKNSLAFTPNKRLALTYLADGDLMTTQGKADGTSHSQYALNQNFGKGVLLNLSREQQTTLQKGDVTEDVISDVAHFETAKDKPNAFSFDSKQVSFRDGRYQNTTALNLHLKPTKAFSVNYSRLDYDSEEVDPNNAKARKEVAASTNSLDFQLQATKEFAVVGGLSQRDTNNETDGDTVSVGLQGQPLKNVTLTAKFDELHNDGKNTKDGADISISNAKPIHLGPLRDLTITARYASLNDQRKLQNETMTGRAAWKIWKNEFLLDYGGITKADGTMTISRLYSFATDPNPKRWFHGSFLYKVRTLIDGKEKLIRRFTADARLNKRTSFVYTYGTLPEDDKGIIQPLTTADIAFKHQLRPELAGLLYFRMNQNDATKVLTRALGFGFEGKLSGKTKFECSYSLEANGYADRYDHTNHLRFGFDQQINADKFLSLSTDVRSHDGAKLQDEIQTNLDFRIKF